MSSAQGRPHSEPEATKASRRAGKVATSDNCLRVAHGDGRPARSYPLALPEFAPKRAPTTAQKSSQK